ncbi:MAG: hypothetical protein ACK57K_06180 [Chryseotalea sp.]
MILELQGLGKTTPTIYNPKTNKWALPNTSVGYNKKVEWDCYDWMKFHQLLVDWFEKGKSPSGIKFAKPEAIKQANKIFLEHFNKNNTFFSGLDTCGYRGQFASYMTSVGLKDVITTIAKGYNALFRSAEKVIDAGEKTVTVASDTLVNTVDNAGKAVVNVSEGVSNISNVGKYLVPVAIGGTVLLVGAYVYKNYIQGDNQIAVPTPGGVVKV